jgi:hypothetical protein
MDDQLRHEGILSKGYGIIPKLVMKDKDLTIESKAIYSYLCSYAGNGDTAFPSVGLMCSDLGISETRYLKHRKTLLDKGYITIKRERKDRKWSNNVYTIAHSVYPQNEGIQNEGIQNEGIQNEGSINNSINNNSINNNSDNKDSPPIKNGKAERKSKYGEFKNVLLTDDEYKKLTERFPNDCKERIERLSLYIESQGKKYKSHYATILSWARRDEQQQPKQPTKEYDYF